MIEELSKASCNDEEIIAAAKELNDEVHKKLEAAMEQDEENEDDENQWMDIEE